MHHAAHDPTYVVLSILVATFGSWTALDLFRRVRAHSGRVQLAWLAATALGMGLSIWSMHFIAMLGFDPGSPVRYDVRLTGLSLLLAIGATAVSFLVAAHGRFRTGRVLVAGAVMGTGICLMHYVGMAALRSAVSLGYKPTVVALSFLVAIVASTAALIAGRQDRSPFWRAAAALLLGLAIVGMHYTAMAALQITPAAGVPVSPVAVEPMVLAFQVALGTVVLLSLGLIASVFDRRAEVIGAMDAGRVGYWELSLPGEELQASSRTLKILGRGDGATISYAEHKAAIHPDDRESRERLLREAIESGSDYSAEYRIVLPDGAIRWVDVRGRVLADGRGRPRKLSGVVLDVTSRHQAYAAAEESERRFRTVADSAPALIWMSDPDGRITFVNRHYEEVFGRPAGGVAETGWRGTVHPDDLPAFELNLSQAYSDRTPASLQARVLDREGAVRWLRWEAVPRFQSGGVFVGYTGCSIDVTDAKLAEEHQQLLLAELDHRVKNTLTVVMGIAVQTARSSGSIEAFSTAFMERLSAMSRAHSLLTRHNWERTALRDLVEVVFAPHMNADDHRVSFSGDEVHLSPKPALAMSLILHELVTNAVKYGALSTPDGRLVLDWNAQQIADGPGVRLLWRETNVAGTRVPSRRGFGSKLIEASVRMELKGASFVEWREDGLEQVIEFPLSS